MKQESYDGSPTLYLIPTPIGNLEDITERSINTLKKVDTIFAEDTRETMKLLNFFNIKKKLITVNDHNEDVIKDEILKILKLGKSVALVADRGTPAISDPGFKCVSYIIENEYNVVSLPGATAFLPVLIASGIVPYPFLFYGFLNAKKIKKGKELEGLKNVNYTLIFYEAPHRLLDTLIIMYNVLGDRKICVAREISKKYEEYYRGTIKKAIDELNFIKGEYVLIVEGNNISGYSHLTIEEHINFYVRDGYSEKEAVKKVAKDRSIDKNELYKKYIVGK